MRFVIKLLTRSNLAVDMTNHNCELTKQRFAPTGGWNHLLRLLTTLSFN